MSKKRRAISIEILADLETPLSVFKKLGNKPFSYLFESVEGGEKWARYSLIGLPSSTVLKVFENEIQIWKKGEIEEKFIVDDPFKYIEDYQENIDIDILHILCNRIKNKLFLDKIFLSSSDFS